MIRFALINVGMYIFLCVLGVLVLYLTQSKAWSNGFFISATFYCLLWFSMIGLATLAEKVSANSLAISLGINTVFKFFTSILFVLVAVKVGLFTGIAELAIFSFLYLLYTAYTSYSLYHLYIAKQQSD